MATIRQLRTEKPAETSAAAAGSLGALVIWLLGLAGVTVDAAAAGGIVLVVGWVAAYVTRRVDRREGG